MRKPRHSTKRNTFTLYKAIITIFCIFFYTSALATSPTVEDLLEDKKEIALYSGKTSGLFKETTTEISDDYMLQFISKKTKKIKDATILKITIKYGGSPEKHKALNDMAEKRLAVLKEYFQNIFPDFTIYTKVAKELSYQPMTFSLPKEATTNDPQVQALMKEMELMAEEEKEDVKKSQKDSNKVIIHAYVNQPSSTK